MHIVSHKLVADAGDKVAPFQAAQVAGGPITPTIVVCHDTAGRLDKFNSVHWFLDEDCTTSAHVVVERDGTATQMVAFNRKAAHAGKSSFDGRSVGNSINSFSVGIEIVNPGACTADGRAWFHKKTEPGFPDLKHVHTKEHGDAYWMDYTPEQVETVKAICKALADAYEIEAITTHWYISPGRKVDTNPLFPLEDVRQFAFGSAKAATLEPMLLQEVKPPSVIAAANDSKTVWALIVGFLSWLATLFQDWVDHIIDLATWALGILPDVVSDVRTTLTNGEMVASWFKLNWAKGAVYVTAACIIVAVIRHINDKRKLAQK